MSTHEVKILGVSDGGRGDLEHRSLTRNMKGREESFAQPEDLPRNTLVPLLGPGNAAIEGYRGVRREDTGSIVSVVSTRYALVDHRSIAERVQQIRAVLEPTDLNRDWGQYPRESIRLYAGGRRMEVKMVIGRRFRLEGGDEFYPGLRILNSLDGSWALRFSGFALRIACQNQLYAERGNAAEWRELHLTSGVDLAARLEVAFRTFLGRFDSILDLYRRSMGERILACEVSAGLERCGLPALHASVIGGRVEAGASHVTLVSRWDAYQVATSYLSKEVHVNPDRERLFERAAARALLLPAPK